MKILLAVLLIAFVVSCSKDKGKGVATPDSKDNNNEVPETATLIQPQKDGICVEGQVYSETVSGITFKWESADHTDSYEIIVKDLINGSEESKTTTGLHATFNLERNIPYSWHVVSKSNSNREEAESETWRFYNAGEGKINHIPFPANELHPAMGEKISVDGGKAVLSWNGSDVDDDLSYYEVYMGTNPDNIKMIGSEVTEEKISDVPVSAGTTYYWKVVSHDKAGNASATITYHFKTK